MRILKHIVNWSVWSLIALYVVVMLAIHLPVCQQYIGGKVADAIADKLGTEVTVGNVDLGFLNRVIIDDVRILDKQQKEMLRVARLSAKLDMLPLTKGKIHISSAQLFGAHARLYRPSASAPTNFQFVLDSLASKDTTSHTPLDLRINSLIMRRSSVSFDQQDAARTEGLLNPQHLNISNISAHIILKTLTDDSLDINVKRLGLTEQSGLNIDKLSFRLKAGRQHTNMSNFYLQMPNTILQSDSLEASYQTDGNRLITSTLNYHGAIKDSYVTPSDLRCFYAPLKNIQRAIAIETSFHGAGKEVTIPHLHLSSQTEDINLQVNGQIDFAPRTPAWLAKIDDLRLSDNMIDFLQKNIPQIPEQLSQIGSLQMSGNLSAESDRSLAADAQIQTGIGNLLLDFQLSGDKTFRGNVNTDGINLSRLLDDEKFGILATDIALDGKIGKAINAQGLITRFDYNDYQFSNIGLNGTYSEEGISGYVKIEDPNVAAELEGALATENGKGNERNLHQLKVKGQVSHLAPKALKLSEKWNNAVFGGNVDADFTARTLNDAKGTLRLSNFSMTAEDENPYYLDNLLITSGYNERQHYVTLISDFAKAELRGDFDYGTLAQSITNFVGSALPTLPGLPPVSNKASNDFALKFDLFKTDWLQRLLGIDLLISQPVTLTARVNDNNKTINMESYLPDFIYNGARYRHGNIHITTPADTIKCNLSLDKLMDNGQDMSISLSADAADNHLRTSLLWDNHQQATNNSGQLNLVATLYQNNEAKPEAHIQVQPSHIILNGTTWNVSSSDVIYSSNNLYVNQFAIQNGLQHIIIDGRATPYSRDSLTIDLNDVEVAYILDLVNFHSVEFSGEASGTASVKSLFGEFDGAANLTVDHFKFENGRMGTLYARVDWNEEAKQIDIRATADDGADAKTIIRGYVSPTYNTIDLGIRAEGTHIDFMHNFTHSFLSSITGHVNGDVRLAGTLDNINLTGQLVVNGQATVTPLNTTYTLPKDTVILVPDDIQLKRIPLLDKYGNKGYLSGGVHHEHLTNLTYDLFVDAENLLAYDFKEFGESTFFGTVYATGDVAIHGKSGEVTIDCNVTPEKNSVFVYNASSPDAISNQEFIEWGSGSMPSKTEITASQQGQTPPEEIDIPADIYINFLINTTPEATLRLLMDENTGDYITLNGDGTIRATFHNKGPFNMYGTYTVDHGTYGITIQNIIKKNFTFNRGGTIVFGGDPYNAALNLQATYTVNGVSLSDLNIGNSFASNTIRVNCLMNIGGQPNAPQVDFDLEMPTVNADEQQMVRSIINGQQEMNQQVLYLLGIGRFYNQGQNNAGTNQPDQTSLAMQSFLSGTLSTQINSLLSTVIKNDNWNFGANISTGNEGWHNAEYEGLISGRMLNNRLLLNGQFGYRDNATQANPSFIGDFDIQYLLYPNGNLALKVYNQTNDRYFTKSSLNTQGIGVIMKKDFNGLRDLFSRSRSSKP